MESDSCGQGEFVATLRAAQAGDRIALETLLVGMQAWLQRDAEQRTGGPLRSRARPSDVAQDALVEVVSRLTTFEGETEAQFRAWVGVIVDNSARQLARFFNAQKRKAPSRTSQLQRLAGELVPEVHSPATELERAEGLAMLNRALGSLREDHRMILEQVSLGGRPIVEVAEEIGRPANSARMLLSRARVALAEALTKLGHGAPPQN